MTLKELAGLCEVMQGLHHTREVLGVYVGSYKGMQFPEIHITEEEYLKHFGNTLPRPLPHDDTYDKMSTIWSGAEVFCLVPKA